MWVTRCGLMYDLITQNILGENVDIEEETQVYHVWWNHENSG